MKIMKVVYMADCVQSSCDCGVSQRYMGEEAWKIGEVFTGEFMSGKVTEIYRRQNGDVMVEVNGNVAMTIPSHAVQRVYFGKGE